MDMTIKTDEGYFNYRVAAVITHNNKLLVMCNEKYNTFYLPGGRVKFNESSDEAIKREIKEELLFDVKHYRPLWHHECFFFEEAFGDYFHELCMYYFVDLTDTGFTNFDDVFTLKEGNRKNKFLWIPFDKLGEQIVYPLFIKDEIHNLPQSLQLRIDREY